jgi:SAM-dependent methyltransferase
LARVGNFHSKRVLDFGCGCGAFAEFLTLIGQEPSIYFGVDVVPEFFQFAQEKMPNGKFCHPDDLGNTRFDFAIASGVFNNRRDDNRHFWKSMTRSLFDRCDEAIAFNMMSTYVDFQSPELFYESPTYAFDFVKDDITPFTSLIHDYVPKKGSIAFEFSIFSYRYPQ